MSAAHPKLFLASMSALREDAYIHLSPRHDSFFLLKAIFKFLNILFEETDFLMIQESVISWGKIIKIYIMSRVPFLPRLPVVPTRPFLPGFPAGPGRPDLPSRPPSVRCAPLYVLPATLSAPCHSFPSSFSRPLPAYAFLAPLSSLFYVLVLSCCFRG